VISLRWFAAVSDRVYDVTMAVDNGPMGIRVTKDGVYGLRVRSGPAVKERLLVTERGVRQHIADTLANSRETGVPEDGVAVILAQWVVGHLQNETAVVSEAELREAGVDVSQL
jgi:hypothetical protein